tara:strand:- start:417 stop:731 length:315 start_codon:yes stop_codon:yes gene_type:complete
VFLLELALVCLGVMPSVFTLGVTPSVLARCFGFFKLMFLSGVCSKNPTYCPGSIVAGNLSVDWAVSRRANACKAFNFASSSSSIVNLTFLAESIYITLEDYPGC